MKTDLISASDLLVSLKSHYRNIEREHELDLAKSLGNFKSIFSAQLETRTDEEVKALIDYLRDVLGSVNSERWGDTPFRILLETFPSDTLDSVDVIHLVKEYEIYAGLGLILCEDAVQCLSNVGTAEEFRQRYAALGPQLMEAANFATKLKSYWFFLNAAAEKIDKVYVHAQEGAAVNHTTKAANKRHEKHRTAKQKVVDRFKEGLNHGNGRAFGEWDSLPDAVTEIRKEMSFPESTLASSNSVKKLTEWITKAFPEEVKSRKALQRAKKLLQQKDSSC